MTGMALERETRRRGAARVEVFMLAVKERIPD
jgi:hypothetical protein